MLSTDIAAIKKNKLTTEEVKKVCETIYDNDFNYMEKIYNRKLELAKIMRNKRFELILKRDLRLIKMLNLIYSGK
ncbi:hypothetical protein COB55_03085 [Candidatus Wolfebacteria bacterium]|nr:MAG: hypothetical protein COB55_03085 [Candidatus Wolfebacteria bacterium]